MEVATYRFTYALRGSKPICSYLHVTCGLWISLIVQSAMSVSCLFWYGDSWFQMPNTLHQGSPRQLGLPQYRISPKNSAPLIIRHLERRNVKNDIFCYFVISPFPRFSISSFPISHFLISHSWFYSYPVWAWLVRLCGLRMRGAGYKKP